MVDPAIVERDVIAALRTCYDPEIPVDIYELGPVYGVTVTPGDAGGDGRRPHDADITRVPCGPGLAVRSGAPGSGGAGRLKLSLL